MGGALRVESPRVLMQRLVSRMPGAPETTSDSIRKPDAQAGE